MTATPVHPERDLAAGIVPTAGVRRPAGPRRALIVVDAQPTFCEGGELPVTGGKACVEAIAAYLAARRNAYTLLVTTQDYHDDPGDHFSDDPDFIGTWPAHGIAGTPNAELHPALRAVLADRPADATIRKGQYAAAYSGFEGTDDCGRTLAQILTDAGITAVDIVGIAESHCVQATALDAVALGLDTTVIGDLTVPVTEDLGVAARERMRAAGVRALSSGQATARDESESN